MDGSEGREGLDNALTETEKIEIKKTGAFQAGMREGLCRIPPFGLLKDPDTCTNPEPNHPASYNNGKIMGYVAGVGIDLALVAGVAGAVYKIVGWSLNI